MRTIGAILAGLLLASIGASAWAAADAHERTVLLTIRHSHFSVSELHVEQGAKIRFVVRNTDPIDHELIVGPMPVQLRHEAGRRAWHPPIPGEVSVPLFGSAETTYTFADRGTIVFACHLPGHWAYGMRGRVLVT